MAGADFRGPFRLACRLSRDRHRFPRVNYPALRDVRAAQCFRDAHSVAASHAKTGTPSAACSCGLVCPAGGCGCGMCADQSQCDAVSVRELFSKCIAASGATYTFTFYSAAVPTDPTGSAWSSPR